MTQTGVSNRTGNVTFYSDGAMTRKEWGGGILPPTIYQIAKGLKSHKVSLVRLSNFLKNEVALRNLPKAVKGLGVPRILMKMDIEGSEIDVLPDLFFNGGLGAINGIIIEIHGRLEKNPERQAGHEAKGKKNTLFLVTRLANKLRL